MNPIFLLFALLACRDPAKPDDSEVPPDDTGAEAVDADGDGFPEEEDCDDTDAAVFPGATEECNGVDDDCDGVADDGLLDLWYADGDGDGWGLEEDSRESCDPGSGWVEAFGDCDDQDPGVFPGATETCDEVDQDCDGEVDEGVETSWYRDADGDGYGDPGTWILACAPGPGWVTDAQDCDDANSQIQPGAAERCNGYDDDCDDLTDDDDDPVVDPTTWYLDADGDGYGQDGGIAQTCDAPPGASAVAGDCDDSDPGRNPGASETDCTDPVDYNCDGSTGWADADGDGWAACQDCDDLDTSVNPDGVERCNGADDDCDGVTDEDDALDAGTWHQDADGDGFGDPATSTAACGAPSGWVSDATDCDDAEAAVHPDAAEVCDGLDNDCSGGVDEPSAVDAATWYADADGDGFGAAAYVTTACDQPTGYVADGTDCDDTDAEVWPGHDETCDGIDDDCDGIADEADAVDAVTWYDDADGDGWGDVLTARPACAQPAGTVADGTDCDDGDAAVHPGAGEHCDGIDEDCDGDVDEEPSDGDTWYDDADGDGYGDPAAAQVTCSQPGGTVADATDCHDDDDEAFPGSTATETPLDGVDQDCDGQDRCTDLNCDGLPDLLFPSHRNDSGYSSSSRVYYNTGHGFAASYGTTLAGNAPLSALVEDLDGDGYPDIVLGGYTNGTTSSVDSYIYWGSAAGYSTSDRSALGTQGVIAIRAADLDDDGWTDVVFASHYGTSYSTASMVYWGSAAGFSDADRTSLSTWGVFDLEIADLDGDGWEDLVFAQYYTGSSYTVGSAIFWGSAAGFSSADKTTLPTYGPVAVEVADLNGDGWLDLAFAGYYSGSSHSTYSYVYWGSATGPDGTNYDALPTYGAWDVASDDLDGDGYSDLVFASYYSGSSYTTSSYVYWGNSGGYSSADRTSLTSYGARAVVAGDLDLDGWGDLFFAQYYSGSTYSFDSYLYWGSSAGYSSGDRTGLGTDGAFRAQRADLDEDGWPDLIVNCYYTGTYALDSFVFYGSAAGYSATDRDDLPVDGPWGHAVVVGS